MKVSWSSCRGSCEERLQEVERRERIKNVCETGKEKLTFIVIVKCIQHVVSRCSMELYPPLGVKQVTVCGCTSCDVSNTTCLDFGPQNKMTEYRRRCSDDTGRNGCPFIFMGRRQKAVM